jgi:hypothetical protein
MIGAADANHRGREKMHKSAIAVGALFAVALTPELASAQACFGTVVGLSGRYSPATGSGFLAVRAGPTASATQVGELFNGNVVRIISVSGRWFRVSADGVAGWVSRGFITQSCGL